VAYYRTTTGETSTKLANTLLSSGKWGNRTSWRASGVVPFSRPYPLSRQRVRRKFQASSDALGFALPWELAECVIGIPSVLKFAIGIGGDFGQGAITCRTGNGFGEARACRILPGLSQFLYNLPKVNPGRLFPKRNQQSLPLRGLDDSLDFCVYQSAACQLYFYAVANFVIAHAGPSCLHLIQPRLSLRVFSMLSARP